MTNLDKIFDGFSKNISEINPVNKILDFSKFSDKELFDYCKKVGFNARIWNRRFIAAIPEVAKRKLYKKHGYYSIFEFAAKMASINNETVNDVLRVNEKLEGMPKIKSLIAEKGLNKVKIVANIVKPETESFWADKIKYMTLSSLRIFINEKFRFKTEEEKRTGLSQEEVQIDMVNLENFRSQNGNEASDKNELNKVYGYSINIPNEFNTQKDRLDRVTFSVPIDHDTEFELRKFKQKLEKEKREPVDWNSTLKEMVKRASGKKSIILVKPNTNKRNKRHARLNESASDTQTFKGESRQTVKSLPELPSRHIPAEIKHDLEQKYSGRCVYIGCNKPAEQIHHPEKFSTRPNHENLMPLCENHHDFIHQTEGNFDQLFNMFKSEKFVTSG